MQYFAASLFIDVVSFYPPSSRRWTLVIISTFVHVTSAHQMLTSEALRVILLNDV